MSQGALRAVTPVPTGNTFDKYGSTSSVVRRLMAGFERSLSELIDVAAPASILDVGCGEGALTAKLADQLPAATVIGLDLPDPRLEGEWRGRERANLRFLSGRAEGLPFGESEFDLVTAIETLEHVPEPDLALAEMARVARSHLLVSVPREPIWRVLNVFRGAYVTQLGNTPGHLHHWSRRGLARLLAQHGRVAEVRTPFPWSMALVEIA